MNVKYVCDCTIEIYFNILTNAIHSKQCLFGNVKMPKVVFGVWGVVSTRDIK